MLKARLVIISCLMAMLCNTVTAQNSFFKKNIRAGYWNNPATWSGGILPGSNDKVMLMAPVTIDADVSCAMLITNGFSVYILNQATVDISGEPVNTANDSLAMLNILTPSGADTLQMRYRINGIEFFVYGTKEDANEPLQVTRTDYRSVEDTATVVHTYLDSQGKGSLMFQSVAGQMDTICYKFTYFDSLVSISAFRVDWDTKQLTLRNIQVIKSGGTDVVPIGTIIPQNPVQSDANLGVGMAACWSVLQPALYVAGGAAIGYFAAPVLGAAALTGALVGGIAGLIKSASSANAAVSDPMVPQPQPVKPIVNPVLTQNPTLLSPPNYGTTLPLVVTEAVKMDAIDKVFVEARTLSDGGSTITARGVCWNTDPQSPPTIGGNKVFTTPAVSPFSIQFIDLEPEVTYYYRSFATNSNGTFYGATLPYTRPETIDTLALLINHGTWDAFFLGASANSDNRLGITEYFRQSEECPETITSFTRIDKINLRFAEDLTGSYGELTDDNYYSAIEFSECTASGLVNAYEWYGEGFTWQYDRATRMLTAQSLPEDGNPPFKLFRMQIEKISETELAGSYYGVDDEDDYIYAGYLRLK